MTKELTPEQKKRLGVEELPLGVNEEGEALICLVCEKLIQVDDLIVGVYRARKAAFFGGISGRLSSALFIHFECVTGEIP